MEDLVAKIIEIGMSQGLWALLYLYLFFRMLKENKEREDKYQETIRTLSNNIEAGIVRIQDKLDQMTKLDQAAKAEQS